MKRLTCTFAFAMLAALAAAQQPAKPSTTAPNPAVAPGAKQTEPAQPSAPAQDPTATTSTTPAPPASAKEDKSVNANQQSKLPQSDAGVAALDTSGMTSGELQQKIEAALHSEPTLSGSNLTVNVTDTDISVSGTVSSGKERTTASRIVQSFGENRKVTEKINVGGGKK